MPTLVFVLRNVNALNCSSSGLIAAPEQQLSSVQKMTPGQARDNGGGSRPVADGCPVLHDGA